MVKLEGEGDSKDFESRSKDGFAQLSNKDIRVGLIREGEWTEVGDFLDLVANPQIHPNSLDYLTEVHVEGKAEFHIFECSICASFSSRLGLASYEKKPKETTLLWRLSVA